MSKSTRKSVSAIHHTALRTVYKKDREFGNSNILELANDISLEERLCNLKENYLKKSISNKNPLIIQLVEEYRNFKNGRVVTVPMVFCGSKVVDGYVRECGTTLNLHIKIKT